MLHAARGLLLSLLFVLLTGSSPILSLALGQTGMQPFVSTDKTSYAQGEWIQYAGHGFTPNGLISACLTTSPPAFVCVGEPNADANGYVSGSMLVGLNIPVGQQAFYLEDRVSGIDSNRVQVSIILSEFDFVLEAHGDISVVQGDVGSGVFIAVTLTSGFPQLVTLSCSSGLPSGAYCSFNPSPGSPTFFSAITVSTSRSTIPGTYQVTVTGVSGETAHATSFRLTVILRTWVLQTSVATGSGSVDPSCPLPGGCRYQAGQSVSITSTPVDGWAFSGWTMQGGSCSAGPSVTPCSLVMNGDATIYGNFNMPTMGDRAINVIYWLLAQEETYTQGQTGFAAALQGTDRTRAYTDDNARLALALTYELEYLRENSQDLTWCGSGNCPSLYDKIKVALQFVLNSQSPGGNFYHYWDFGDSSWHDSGKLYYWNAAVLEGLAIVATKMRWKGLGHQADFAFYDSIIKLVESTLNSYQGNRNPDGSWNFVYTNTQGAETQDARLAENGMLLAALVGVITYELNASGFASRNAQTYAGWAQSLANWIMGLQETHADRIWLPGGGYGGFYDNAVGGQQSSSENGRSVFGLALYSYSNASILQASQAQSRTAIQVWLDHWVSRSHDEDWGPLYRMTAGPSDKYPENTYAAAVLGTATTSGWVFFNDAKYKSVANNFYVWATGQNDKQTDLQYAYDRNSVPQAGHVGFYIAINQSSIDYNSNVETNSEMLEFMVALSDPSIIWNITQNQPTSAPPSVPGFPIESVLVGILGGLLALSLIRRRRTRFLVPITK